VKDSSGGSGFLHLKLQDHANRIGLKLMASSGSSPELEKDHGGKLAADLSDEIVSASATLAGIGRIFYEKNWVLGTSGNFSTVISRDPFVLLITVSGAHKGELSGRDFLCLNSGNSVLGGSGKPSAETSIHLAIIQERGAGAILHTHSIWATLLSDMYGSAGGFTIEGYEMLKGLYGVQTHQHSEWLPILANNQDYVTLSAELIRLLRSRPDVHGVLLQGHGLYTWGAHVQEARRHVEVLEFLMAVSGTKLSLKSAI
jgi:methylthioribulose-1-phosphate dehydratase